jgi:hypothetical protein
MGSFINKGFLVIRKMLTSRFMVMFVVKKNGGVVFVLLKTKLNKITVRPLMSNSYNFVLLEGDQFSVSELAVMDNDFL